MAHPDLPGRTAAGQAVNVALPTQWISRVIAVAGQKLRMEGEQLLVDGLPAKTFQAAGLTFNPDGAFIVPEGQVVVAPENLVAANITLNTPAWTQLAVISQDNIFGRIFFRSLPLWRMSRFP